MKFIGIDVHEKRFTAACINEKLDISYIGDMGMNEIIEFIAAEKPGVIAVDAPYGINLGLMNDEEYRQNLTPNLKGHYNKKVSEYELSRRGITPFSTPGSMDEITGWKSWMKSGFYLYEGIEKLGFNRLDGNENHGCGIIEVFPHACFTTLLGFIPDKKLSDAGRNQRLAVLEKVGFTNISTFLQGTKHVIGDKMDALIAAFTALSAYNGEATFVGDRKEGQIAVPVIDLKDKYKKVIGKAEEKTAEFEKTGMNCFEYRYLNVDSILWLKYFKPIGHNIDIYSVIDFKSTPNLRVNAKIFSEDNCSSVEVVLEAISKSIHGMKPAFGYKDKLRDFWGSHGDKKNYRVIVYLKKDF